MTLKSELADGLDRDGFAVLENMVSTDDLAAFATMRRVRLQP